MGETEPEKVVTLLELEELAKGQTEDGARAAHVLALDKRPEDWPSARA